MIADILECDKCGGFVTEVWALDHGSVSDRACLSKSCVNCGKYFFPENQQKEVSLVSRLSECVICSKEYLVNDGGYSWYCSEKCKGIDDQALMRKRFDLYVSHEQDKNGCLNWRGPVFQSGMPKLVVCKFSKLAHRVSYALMYGHITSKVHIVQSCRNKLCVNAEHLKRKE